MPLAIYNVSGASNRHQAYVLKNGGGALALVEVAWGAPQATGWKMPELVVVEETASRPISDFTSVYVPGLLAASRAAADAIAYSRLECLPVLASGEKRYFLNPQTTIRRFRKEGANVVQAPSGAVLMMNAADFYSEDIPVNPEIFWFHDGNAPRFLLCNETFKNRVESAGLSGLSFQRLGYAH